MNDPLRAVYRNVADALDATLADRTTRQEYIDSLPIEDIDEGFPQTYFTDQ